MLKKLCCMQLRSAGVVVGWLGVAGSIIFFSGSIITLSQKDAIAESAAAKNPNLSKAEIIKGIKHCLRMDTYNLI